MGEKELKRKINKVLLELSITPKNLGYEYIVTSLELSCFCNKYDNFSRSLYPKVAEIFDDEATNIEKMIRYSLDEAFIHINYEVLEKYFGNTINKNKAKATNKQFIKTIKIYLESI